MSERAPAGGAVHLRACPAPPTCVCWCRKSYYFSTQPSFFQPELVTEEKKLMELRL